MSTARKLHPDWPDYTPGDASYDHPIPVGDLAYALEAAPAYTAETTPKRADTINLGQIAEVVRYHVSYHEQEWTPTNDAAGTELTLIIIAGLTDGRWASIQGWNDYTGWGCQDGAEVRIGATEDDVVWHGLDAEGRRKLGYPETTLDEVADGAS